MPAEPGRHGADEALSDPRDLTTVAETTPGRAEPRPLAAMPGLVGGDFFAVHARYSSIPMPDPEGLKLLVELYPQAAEVIFNQMAAQSNHRIELEKAVATTNNTLALRGQWIGGLIGGIGLVGSITR